MWLQVRNRRFRITRELRTSIRRRMRFVLGRVSNRIGQVTIHLEELASLPLEKSKRCQIVVQLKPVGEVSSEDIGGDISEVIIRASERIGRSVQRELERRRDDKNRPQSRKSLRR